MNCKNMINTKYCNFVKQSKAKQLLYILTNNYFKFLFQKIFFVMRCLTLCAFGSGVDLVKSFLTLIKFNFDSLLMKIKNYYLAIILFLN